VVGSALSSLVEERGRGSNAGVVGRAGSPFCPTTRLERGPPAVQDSPVRLPRPVRQSSHPLAALITTLFSELGRAAETRRIGAVPCSVARHLALSSIASCLFSLSTGSTPPLRPPPRALSRECNSQRVPGPGWILLLLLHTPLAPRPDPPIWTSISLSLRSHQAAARLRLRLRLLSPS
jgi:hypothetical protein